jgi:site-specific DNA-cytosine methylase
VHLIPTFVDLFCGCGGFTLGMERAGLRCLAAVDSNAEAIAVFRANFPHVPHILQEEQQPNQALHPTADRRVNLHMITSTLKFRATLGSVSGG